MSVIGLGLGFAVISRLSIVRYRYTFRYKYQNATKGTVDRYTRLLVFIS